MKDERMEQDCAEWAGEPDDKEFTPINIPFFPMDMDEYLERKAK